jgi:exonuclease SbcC
MVIRKIRIQNYTSHQDTTIEFDKLVTSIVGFSDQGKTNVFHALRTVLFAEDWPVTDIRD